MRNSRSETCTEREVSVESNRRRKLQRGRDIGEERREFNRIYLARGVEDVADGERDDAGVVAGAVHGERLPAAGLAVREGGAVEPVDGGADEGAHEHAVDPLVRGRPVEHVVCIAGVRTREAGGERGGREGGGGGAYRRRRRRRGRGRCGGGG